MYRSGCATSSQKSFTSKNVPAVVILTKFILQRITGHSFLLNFILLEVRKIAQIGSADVSLCFTYSFWAQGK